MIDQQDMIRKISALLKKAEGTDNENEAASFFAKANELMLKHAVEEAMVRASMTDRSKIESPVKEDWMFATHDAHAKGKSALVWAIAKANHVQFLVYSNRAHSNTWREGNQGAYSQWGILVGYKSDIENVKLLYTSLLIQWARFVRHDMQESYIAKKEEYGFKTGHLVGFASRIGRRFQEIATQVLDTTGMALMVNKDQEVDSVYQQISKSSRVSRQRAVDGAGYRSGTSAADRADIGQIRVGNNARQVTGG